MLSAKIIKGIVERAVMMEAEPAYVRIDQVTYDFQFDSEEKPDVIVKGQYGYHDANDILEGFKDFSIYFDNKDLRIFKIHHITRGYIRAKMEE